VAPSGSAEQRGRDLTHDGASSSVQQPSNRTQKRARSPPSPPNGDEGSGEGGGLGEGGGIPASAYEVGDGGVDEHAQRGIAESEGHDGHGDAMMLMVAAGEAHSRADLAADLAERSSANRSDHGTLPADSFSTAAHAAHAAHSAAAALAAARQDSPAATSALAGLHRTHSDPLSSVNGFGGSNGLGLAERLESLEMRPVDRSGSLDEQHYGDDGAFVDGYMCDDSAAAISSDLDYIEEQIDAIREMQSSRLSSDNRWLEGVMQAVHARLSSATTAPLASSPSLLSDASLLHSNLSAANRPSSHLLGASSLPSMFPPRTSDM